MFHSILFTGTLKACGDEAPKFIPHRVAKENPPAIVARFAAAFQAAGNGGQRRALEATLPRAMHGAVTP